MERGDTDALPDSGGTNAPQRPPPRGPLARYWPLWAGLAVLVVVLIGGVIPVLVGGTPGAGTTPQDTGTDVLPGSYVPPSGQLPGSATSAAGASGGAPVAIAPSAPATAASGPRGTAQLVGSGSDLRLSLRVSGLPASPRGYAVRLATPGPRGGGPSLLLGRLYPATAQGVYPLPHRPGAYQLIEISRPASGAPLLTAPNPAHRTGPAAWRSVQLRETASRSTTPSTSK